MAELTIEDRVKALEDQKALNDAQFEALEEQINRNANVAATAATAANVEVERDPIKLTVGKKTYVAKVEKIKAAGKTGLITHLLRDATPAELNELLEKYPSKFEEVK